MRILLIACPYKYENGCYRGNQREFLGIGYIGSTLRQAGHKVTIIDPGVHNMEPFELNSLVQRGKYDFIGISITERSADVAVKIVKDIRTSGYLKLIIAGGHYPTLACAELFRNSNEIDIAVIGEGEQTIIELAEKIENNEDWKSVFGIAYLKDGKLIETTGRSLVQDLDEVPFPSRDLLPLHIEKRGNRCYMVGSRGCYGTCSYCSMNMFYALHPHARKWRARSAKNIVDEMEMLNRKYKVEVIAFDDDNFIGPGKRGHDRALEIASEINARGLKIGYIFPCRPNDVDFDLFTSLKESGLFGVFLGIDSMNQRSLDLFNRRLTVEDNLKAIKILDELGLKQEYGFINYDPYSTIPEIKRNFGFIKERMEKHKSENYVYSLLKGLEIYDNSPLLENAKENNVLITDEDGNYLKDELGYIYKLVCSKTDSIRKISFKLKRILLDSLNNDLSEKLTVNKLGNKPGFLNKNIKDLSFKALYTYGDLLDKIEQDKITDDKSETEFLNNFKSELMHTMDTNINNYNE